MLNAQELAKVKRALGGKDDDLSAIFDALSNPTRCHLFRSFLKESRLCVSDVSSIENISMSSASQHLKILEVRGLLVREQEGRVVYYLLNHDNRIAQAILKAVA